MKLERLDEYVTTVTAVLVGVGVAYWCGLMAGEGSFGKILGLLGGLVFAVALLILRQHIWLLIPATWSLAGQLPELRGSPALRDVITIGVAVATFMLIAFKVVRRRPRYDFIDLCVWGSALYLCIAYLRHPTGGYVLNSDRIGGRAYLNTLVALIAFWVMARVHLPSAGYGRGLLFCTVWSRMGVGWFNAAAYRFPSLVARVAPYYTGVDVTSFNAATADPLAEKDTRLPFLADIAEPALRRRLANHSPVELVNPFHAFVSPYALYVRLALLTSLVLLALTGFRSALVSIAFYFAVTAYLKKGLRDLLILLLLFFLGIVGLFLLQQTGVVNLPMPAQRALSFLPGRWDPAAKADARHSSDWRIFMWAQMLGAPDVPEAGGLSSFFSPFEWVVTGSPNKYLQNRWFGDGFGFSMQQYQLMLSAQKFGDPHEMQESLLVVGQVHSGPVSAIRYVGIVGLGFYLFMAFYLCREAWRLCRETRGTPFEAVTFFFCLPIIWQPICFILVYGSYDGDLPTSIFAAGLLKMLRNTVDHHFSEKPPAEPEIPETLKPQRRLAGPVRRPALPRPA